VSDEPHVACIFRSTRHHRATAQSAEWSQRMDQLVTTMPGYIGHVSFRDESTGRGVTISYFENMASQWREQAVHREAQALGRSDFYDEYEIEVVQIVRHHEWRAHPPAN
jgi:heme-degrading monooxygenase HmoA